METVDLDLTPFFVWNNVEGEEHIPKLLLNESECQSNVNLATDTRVPGRIKGHHEFYESIGADPYICNVVKNGYKLELDVIPPPSFTENNKSALQKPDFMWQELLRLEELGCIERVVERPTVVLPLSVVFSKKWRLVVDASRTLNPYCLKRKIKLEDLTHVQNVVRQNDYMVVNDLDSGYWHVQIAQEHWQYLGVHFRHEDGSVTFWVWKVLCLGLRDAAFIFTKTIAPIMAKLRSDGMRGLVYIDDKLTSSNSYDNCCKWEQYVKNIFEKAGWTFKPGKRSGNPSQVCRFLGLEIDSRDMTFNIPEDKLIVIEEKAREILKRKFNKVRILASFVGLLQSIRKASGPIVSVMTRSLYFAINNAKRWESFVRIDDLAKTEVKWWLENVRKVKKFPISDSLSSVATGIKVASDGSSIGFYSYEVDSKKRLACRAYSAVECKQSSTYRKLLAFHATWTSRENLECYRNKRIAHFTDNKALVFIIAKGSRNRTLHPLIVEVTLKLREFGIKVDPVWLSREEGMIKYADMGSRDFHSDDISLDYFTFQEAERKFGSFTVDGFASSGNAKCSTFFSRRDVPGSAGVDFFMQTLKPSEFYWLFPPISMVCQAIEHLAIHKARGVVLVPVWPRSSFFSYFFPDGMHVARWAVKCLWVRPYFITGSYVQSTGLRGRKKFSTVLLEANFSDFIGSFYEYNLLPDWCRNGGCHRCNGS